jgi:hypothetical protein
MSLKSLKAQKSSIPEIKQHQYAIFLYLIRINDNEEFISTSSSTYNNNKKSRISETMNLEIEKKISDFKWNISKNCLDEF